MFAAGFLPIYTVVMISLLLAGVAKSIIDPTLQGIAGNIVPFEKRGMVIGIMEFAWAASTLVGIPLSGVIIEKYNWQTPFLIIGCLSLLCFFIILVVFPNDRKQMVQTNTQTNKEPGIIKIWREIIQHRRVKAMFVFVFFMCLANDNLFVIYGIWLEESFKLSLAAIGAGAFFIGLAELFGEALTAFFSDKIGLKKSIVMGVFLTMISYFLLMFLDEKLGWVLWGLFILFLTFEFTIVSSMSLSTELVPGFRASTMSAYFAVAGIGRVIGAFSGGFLWNGFGIAGISILSGICTFLALVAILIGFYPLSKKN